MIGNIIKMALNAKGNFEKKKIILDHSESFWKKILCEKCLK